MESSHYEKLISEIKLAPSARQWEHVGVTPHHGICVPLFSLHSEKSAGIGEFKDLIPLITWCSEVGLDTLQLLPLNDTGPNHSPYSALSAFALNPLHLSLFELPGISKNPQFTQKLEELQNLTSTDRVNYSKIQPLREKFLKDYFDQFSLPLLSSEDYQLFCTQNSWLLGYSLFKAMKDHSKWQSWETWPEEIKNPSPEIIKELIKKYEIEVSYHSFIQYHCFLQLCEVKQHANTLGIFLKGDLPILVDRESADLWLHRSLFDMNFSAGAPPDAYALEGQNWGFPLYNWKEMEKQNFDWWKQRLQVASQFYHLYRIDHVVGFFRIWAIEAEHLATDGLFIPSDPDKALQQGTKLLQMMLAASPMLPIGEDLGSIPPEVRLELANLGICGTKVMRWERDWNKTRQFIRPECYLPLSVTTVSTHDSSTLQLWWLENSNEAQAYCQSQGWNYQVPLSPEYHFALLYTSHHTSSLFHINLLQEYLAIISDLTHSNPKLERINTPGTISENNWSYRYIPNIESLCTNPELARLIRDLKA